jgi:hypothetical protein
MKTDLIKIKRELNYITRTLFFLNSNLEAVAKLVDELETKAPEEEAEEEPEALAPESSVYVERSSITANFTEEELQYLYEEEQAKRGYFEGL